MLTDPQLLKYTFTEGGYKPLITGKASCLLACVELHGVRFPRSVEVFGSILRNHLQRHPLLEDWLIIPHYQFFWDANEEALQWFEGLYDEAIRSIGEDAWQEWLVETITQTDCERFCKRFCVNSLEGISSLQGKIAGVSACTKALNDKLHRG